MRMLAQAAASLLLAHWPPAPPPLLSLPRPPALIQQVREHPALELAGVLRQLGHNAPKVAPVCSKEACVCQARLRLRDRVVVNDDCKLGQGAGWQSGSQLGWGECTVRWVGEASFGQRGSGGTGCVVCKQHSRPPMPNGRQAATATPLPQTAGSRIVPPSTIKPLTIDALRYQVLDLPQQPAQCRRPCTQLECVCVFVCTSSTTGCHHHPPAFTQPAPLKRPHSKAKPHPPVQ